MMMYKDAIIDELRQIELDVVEDERRLAELEALLEDTTKVQDELEVARKNLFDREQSRQRLLSLLHP
jgi:hypothetical protein